MAKKKTNEQFKKEVYDLAGDEYTFLEPYQGSSKKIRVKHNKCGYEYSVAPHNFLLGKRCPSCQRKNSSKHHTKTPGEFEHEVYTLVGDEYTVLTPYVKAKIKVKIKHNKCGNSYWVTPNKFLRGRRCPYCNGSIAYTDKEFRNKLNRVFNGTIELIKKYVPGKPVNVKCLVCGNTWIVNSPSSLLKGHGCSICANRQVHERQTLTLDDFKERVRKRVGTDYQVVGSYTNIKTPILIHHSRCNHTYTVTPSNFLNGQRCPYCNMSVGEHYVMESLDELHIKYVFQKKFSECRDKRVLPFDFYLPEHNMCIEYDGEQHRQVNAFGSKDKKQAKWHFEVQHKHDLIKNKYCEDNNIRLLRLWYSKNNTLAKVREHIVNAL